MTRTTSNPCPPRAPRLARRPGYPLTLAAAALAALSGSASGEPMLHHQTFYRNADMARWVDNYIELGAGYNNKDSYRFGEWNGLREEGAYPIVGFHWLSRGRDNDALYWRAQGSGLGLETRKLSIEGGEQGRWRLAASADRLVRSELDTARFIHQGLGGSNLTLAAGCSGFASIGAINAACLTPYKVEQGRDFYRLGFTGQLGGAWELSVNYREDVRDGTRVMGFITNSFQSIPTPYQIDDHTQQVEALLGYALDGHQFQLGYSYSRYDNKLDALVITNPIGAAPPEFPNRMSLAPGNEFHQLQATGSYRFSADTRLTGKLSYAIGTQDQAFLPYSINGAAANLALLPRASLDGEVVKTLADLTLTMRPSAATSLKLGYQYYDFDSRTPIAQYLYASRDAAAQGAAASANTRSNAPVSTTEHKVSADGDYRFGGQWTLRGLIEYTQKDYALTDRAGTETTKAGIELRKPVFDGFLGSLGYTFTQRTGSPYDKNTFFRNSYTNATFQTNTTGGSLTNHPSMRSFMYADFDEDRLRATSNWAVSETVSLQFGVDGYQQRYKDPNCAAIADPNVAAAINKNEADPALKLPDTCLGRALAEGVSGNLDLQWQPEENFMTFAFINIAQTRTEQNGRTWRTDDGTTALPADESFSAADQRRNWFGEISYLDHAVGFGAKWQPTEIWDLGGHYVFSNGIGKTAIIQGAAPSLGAGNAGALAPATAMPDSESTLHSVQLYAKWMVSRKMTLRLNYLYEALRSRDWGYDNLAPTSNANVLQTGQGSPKYENHVVGVSVALHGW
jgi:MtrB/PioB family decaheme-associated outer membrane protein